MAAGERLQLNLDGLAQVLDRTANTVKKYVERGMPAVQRGARGTAWLFDAAECVAWFARHEVERSLAERGVSDEAPVDLSLERARLARAQTESAELRNATLRGELVPARAVLEHWAAQIVAATTHLRAVPSQLKGEIPHLTADEVMIARRLVDRACSELADGLPERAGSDLDEGEGEVAATA